MKLELELKPGDIVLLKVLACVLIIFFTFRFLILPGVGKHQDLDLEKTQVDELVTGIILKHNLFPVNLSISETTPGIPMSYILASAKASETHVLTAEEELNGETEAETDGDGTDSGFYAAPQFDYTNTSMVSVTVQGSESEIKSFLDDLARNYPGIQARSFEIRLPQSHWL